MKNTTTSNYWTTYNINVKNDVYAKLIDFMDANRIHYCVQDTMSFGYDTVKTNYNFNISVYTSNFYNFKIGRYINKINLCK